MKYFLSVCLLLSLFSCSKHLSNSDQISAIIHQAGLGGDTLYYHYDESGRISYVESRLLRYQYFYENNRIVLRNVFENSSLLESDSVNYDINDNISKFIAHRFAYDTFPEERDQTDFTYQGNKLITANSKFVILSVLYQGTADFSWDNGNIKKIVLKSSPTDSTKILFSYSSVINPFTIFGQQAWLLDPDFNVTRYDNLQRIAYLSSGQCAVGADLYFYGNSFMPITIDMQVNRDKKISVFQISPTDEYSEYHYGEFPD